MHRAIVLIPVALLLAGCTQLVWKADKFRYPTKAAEVTALERHRDRCLMESRVILAPRSGTRVATDNALFSACMEAAGFTLVGEENKPAPPTPAKTAEKPDEISETRDVAAPPPATPGSFNIS